jgi:hypothetical protein
MSKLTKYELFQIAATMLSGSESFQKIGNDSKVTKLLELADVLNNRQDEKVEAKEKHEARVTFI